MAYTLEAVNSGCFNIDGIPYQRGNAFPVWNTAGDKMGIYVSYDKTRKIIPEQSHTEYIDASTGLPFASMAALITFAQLYIFKRSDTPAPDPTVVRLRYYIKTVPVASNEKPEGASITDTALQNLTDVTLMINNDIYQQNLDCTVDNIAGTIETDGNVNTFVDGDVVTIIGNQIP